MFLRGTVGTYICKECNQEYTVQLAKCALSIEGVNTVASSRTYNTCSFCKRELSPAAICGIPTIEIQLSVEKEIVKKTYEWVWTCRKCGLVWREEYEYEHPNQVKEYLVKRRQELTCECGSKDITRQGLGIIKSFLQITSQPGA